MRRILAIVVLALTLSAPAVAQEGGKLRVVKPAETKALRGPAEAPETAPGDLSDLVPVPPPVRPIASTLPVADDRQCRRACTTDYYFCLSGEDDRCPQVWTSCLAACK